MASLPAMRNVNEVRPMCRARCLVLGRMIVGLDGSFLREPHAGILAGTLARYNRSISHRLARRGTFGPVVDAGSEQISSLRCGQILYRRFFIFFRMRMRREKTHHFARGIRTICISVAATIAAA